MGSIWESNQNLGKKSPVKGSPFCPSAAGILVHFNLQQHFQRDHLHHSSRSVSFVSGITVSFLPVAVLHPSSDHIVRVTSAKPPEGAVVPL